MTGLIRFFVQRGLLVNLISIAVMLLGLFAAYEINREAFPNVNLDQIQIGVSYPGATPEEVERLVITPIEQEIKALNGIDKMISVSFPGSGTITLDLDPDATNRERITSDVQLAVDRADLPDDLPRQPYVLEIDGTVFPVIRLAISAPLPPVELKRLGDQIEQDLLNLEGVAMVQRPGDRKAELRIVVDPEKMHRHRVSISQVSELLRGWNINAPVGELDTDGGQKALRIVGEFRDPRDVASLVLRANERGDALRLGDIASVEESLAEPRVLYNVSGETALSMIILKKTDADIIDVVDTLRGYLDRVPEIYGEQVHVKTFEDFSRFTRMRLAVLTNNGAVGIVLVFLSLFMFLRPSVATTTTWGLPIVFSCGLYILYLSGMTLNLISMLGFIMVLGMLVDDAIIIGENITYHMERGLRPLEAAVKGAIELIGPVTTTVTTTIVAFLPMLFMSGIIGKFIVSIPVVVMLMLALSLLESFFILPSHVAHIAHPRKQVKERAWLVAMENGYARLLKLALKLRWLTIAISVAMLVGSVWLARNHMSFQLFPPAGVDQYVLRVTAPSGITLERMQERLLEVDRKVRESIEPRYLEATIITAGQIAMDAGDPLTQRGSRYGQIRVLYTPAVSRPEHDAMDDMHRLAREIPPLFPGLKIAFTEIKGGPPTGRPLEVEISSNDSKTGETAARRLIGFLEQVEGVTSVESGLQRGDDELHIVLDRGLAAYAGVDLATAANHLRAAVDGLVVTTLRRGTEEIDVTIRFPDFGKRQLEMIGSLEIPNRQGGLVPLEKIARFEEHPGYSTIRHKAGIRVVTVTANIDTDRLTSVAINRLVMEKESQWLGDAAGRVTVNYGGEEEKNQESVRDLMFSFLFAIVGIFFILAIQFNSLGYPIIVLLAIPFGAIGIIVSFYLHDLFWRPMPLSFFALMGMVALSGVVVNSALVLLVFVQRAIEQGLEWREAIIQAGRRRLRAVVLTAATTVLGLLPTAYGWGGMDPFVSPMALALSSGLAFATVITLLAIPAILAASFDVQKLFRKLTGRGSRT
ncbi:MAG TPA: efflux RND transporter permease subunit [Gammaproteobacteria bacterium]|nr:efflux RND transporter permease subunit [Gammaproteobacteria bacterium]